MKVKFINITFNVYLYRLNKAHGFMVWTDEEIKGKVLHKLTRLGKFDHAHTSIDNLPKGFPSDLRGRVKDLVKELIKERILLTKPTHYGVEVSVDTGEREKVMDYIDIFLKKKD